MIKKTIITACATIYFAGCSTDANVTSRNLARASEMFEVERRIVFYNGITGDYVLTIEGKCSVDPKQVGLAVTCKTGIDEYKMHYLGLSHNVTYFSEQLREVAADVYRYRVIFKPETIIPNIDLETSINNES